jgi:hypothetical protein
LLLLASWWWMMGDFDVCMYHRTLFAHADLVDFGRMMPVNAVFFI